MREELKLVKLRCDKTGKYMGARVKKVGLKWEIVDVIPMTASEGAVVTSEVTQSSFETHSNLQACAKCGKRKIGGCSHVSCPRDLDEYYFQCVYCQHMTVDNARPTSLGAHRVGDVVKLSQGQVIKIQSATGGALERIQLRLNWDPARYGANMDVDSSVFVREGSNWEMVYFGKLTHGSGAIVHHGDNLTGEDCAQDFDESIDIYLKKATRSIDKMIIVLNVYDCEDRGQTLGDIKNPYLTIWDPVANRKLVEYRVLSNLSRATALVIGSLTKVWSDWEFKAIGSGSDATDLFSLLDECKRRY